MALFNVLFPLRSTFYLALQIGTEEKVTLVHI
jgi:hypothetical protein